jgi:hypothetical protein
MEDYMVQHEMQFVTVEFSLTSLKWTVIRTTFPFVVEARFERREDAEELAERIERYEQRKR